MDLRELWRAVARRWWILVAFLALAAAGAFAYLTITPPVYQAVAEVVLIANAPSTIGETQQGVSTTNQLAETAATIIDSPALLESAATDQRSAADLADMITVSARAQTSTIDIVAWSDSPDEAADAANAAAGAAQEGLPPLLGATGEGDALPLAVETLRPATSPSAPFSPDRQGVIVIGLALGLCAGLAVAIGVDAARRPRQG